MAFEVMHKLLSCRNPGLGCRAGTDLPAGGAKIREAEMILQTHRFGGEQRKDTPL